MSTSQTADTTDRPTQDTRAERFELLLSRTTLKLPVSSS